MARLGVGTGGAAGGSSTRGCTYKKGVCHIHGEGAIKKWKPSFITEVGPDGKKTRRYAKKYEYVCDTSLNGRKLYQSRLSFPSMTVNARGGGAADIIERGEDNLSTSTIKEGQNTTTTTSCVQTGEETTR